MIEESVEECWWRVARRVSCVSGRMGRFACAAAGRGKEVRVFLFALSLACMSQYCMGEFVTHPVHLHSIKVHSLQDMPEFGGMPPTFSLQCVGERESRLYKVNKVDHTYKFDSNELQLAAIPPGECKDCGLLGTADSVRRTVGSFSMCSEDFVAGNGQIEINHGNRFELVVYCEECEAAPSHNTADDTAKLWRFISTKGSRAVEQDDDEGHVGERLWDVEEMSFYDNESCQGDFLPAAKVDMIGCEDGPWHGIGTRGGTGDPPYLPHTERWFTFEPPWGGSYIKVQLETSAFVKCVKFKTWDSTGSIHQHRAARFPEEAQLEFSTDGARTWQPVMRWHSIDDQNGVKLLKVDPKWSPESDWKVHGGHHGGAHFVVLFVVILASMALGVGGYRYYLKKVEEGREEAQMKFQAMFDDPELDMSRADDERAMQDLAGVPFVDPPASEPQGGTYRAPTGEENFSGPGGWA